jgi:putative membrane protein
MKKMTSLLFALCILAWACNNESKDSVEKADSANSSKMNATDSGTASKNQTITTDEATSSFLVDAANGGMTEVKAGQIASEKAKDARVKNFAAMMVHDHSAANDQVRNLASQRNVTLPAAVSDANQKATDDLGKKTGSDFDKSFMNMMVKDHNNAIDMFKKAADKVNDTEVKSFINNTLPTLQMHLDSAKAVQKRLK